MPEPNTDGCRHLEIYKIAHALGVRIHAMTLRLPLFEMHEEGTQVRRSSKSVSSQLVEEYRLRKHWDKFLLYLHGAAGSADETREHLDFLFKFIVEVERQRSKPFYLRPEARAGGQPPLGNGLS